MIWVGVHPRSHRGVLTECAARVYVSDFYGSNARSCNCKWGKALFLPVYACIFIRFCRRWLFLRSKVHSYMAPYFSAKPSNQFDAAKSCPDSKQSATSPDSRLAAETNTPWWVCRQQKLLAWKWTPRHFTKQIILWRSCSDYGIREQECECMRASWKRVKDWKA